MSDYSELKQDAQDQIDGHEITCDPVKVLALIAESKRLAELLECAQGDIRTADKIIAERDRLLLAIPECPVHGPCVPHAIEWVEKIMLVAKGLTAENKELRKDADRLQSATAFVQKLCDSAGKQPSVATGYLHDILSALGQGEQS